MSAARYAILAALAAGAAGFALGEAVALKSTERSIGAVEHTLAALRDAPPPVVNACPGVDLGLARLQQSTDALGQRLARVEQGTLAVGAGDAGASTSPGASALTRTDDNERARFEGESVIARASQEGTWRESDLTAFRQAELRMEPGDIGELRQRLLGALNDGTVKKAFRGSAL